MKRIARALVGPVRPVFEYLRLPKRAKAEIRKDRGGLLFDDPGPEDVVALGIGWLATAQDHSPDQDGGVARHYSFVSGWVRSYPETTGYIVPTFLDWYKRHGDVEIRDRAHKMLRWFREIQFPDGGFQGGVIGAQPKVPVTFNTGQILLGLAAGVEQFGDEFLESMRGAADWLRDTQDADGAWRKHPTPFALSGEKTYETHVAWGLFEAARVDADRGYGQAGIRNVDWALSKQRENGWLEDCCLDQPETPLTHTIGYALKGILECWRYSNDDKYLEAATRALAMIEKLVKEDGRLEGRFDSSWNPVVPWVCVTGCAQLADCFLIAATAGGSGTFLETGRKLNRFVRRTVRTDGPDEIRGGVKGAYPVDGAYGELQLLNWAAKFAIDSNLRELDLAGRSAA